MTVARHTAIRHPGLLILTASVLLAAFVPAGMAADTPAAPAKEYAMGVFPHLPPRDLEKVFAPMASDLGKTLGRRVVLRSNTTFERFADNLDKQEFDIAFVQPFDYVRVADTLGYRPLATRTEKLAAIVVVKQGSPIKGVADLKGKRIALPPQTAAVTLLLRGHLRANGINPDKDVRLSHHRSHVSCMQKVVIGEADACGTAAPALRFFQEKMKTELIIVTRSREIPHTLFAIHPRVPKKDRDAIQARILGWGESKEGQEILARGQLKPFVPIKDADYDVVREMAR